MKSPFRGIAKGGGVQGGTVPPTVANVGTKKVFLANDDIGLEIWDFSCSALFNKMRTINMVTINPTIIDVPLN